MDTHQLTEELINDESGELEVNPVDNCFNNLEVAARQLLSAIAINSDASLAVTTAMLLESISDLKSAYTLGLKIKELCNATY